MYLTIKGSLLLGTSLAMATPVLAQCDPSHAVVAIASILSTLAFVTLVLIGAYCFLKHKANKGPKGREKTKNWRAGHTNPTFTHNEELATFEEGVTPSKRAEQANHRDQVLARVTKDDIFHTPPRKEKTGMLYREGSHVSLDANVNCVEAETISVILESQDIIGLGFNICGSYGDGIRVSEVHNRGPAKESGVVKVGDRILSVTVSYHNIVYEDALTILSYGSPYPVKIVLEKVTDDNLKNFVDVKENGNSANRIRHPLYHRRSLDTLKSASRPVTTAHPKRAVTDLKLDSVKHLLNWHGKHSKKGQSSEKDGTTSSKHSRPRNDNLAFENENVIIWERELNNEKDQNVHDLHLQASKVMTTFQNNSPSYSQAKPTSYDTAVEIVSKPEVKSAGDYISKNASLHKPEKSNRINDDIRGSYTVPVLEKNQTTPASKKFAYAINSVTDDEIDVDEIITTPETSEKDFNGDSEREDETQKHAWNVVTELELLRGKNLSDQSGIPSLVKADSLEDITTSSDKQDFLTSTSQDEFLNRKQELSNNNTILVGGIPDSSLFGNGIFAPEIQSWESKLAEVSQGSLNDDFSKDPSVYISKAKQKSNNEVLFPETKSYEPIEKEYKESVYISDLGLNDFFSTGPLFNEVSSQKHLVRTGSVDLQPIFQHQVDSSISENSPVHLSASSNFVNSQDLSDSSTENPDNNSNGTAVGDSLEWSGSRLVRSRSLSNIFTND